MTPIRKVTNENKTYATGRLRRLQRLRPVHAAVARHQELPHAGQRAMCALTKPWSQLEAMAARSDFILLRSPGGVSLYEGSFSLLTITGGTDDTISDAELDAVIRAALEPALVRLAEIVTKEEYQ